MFLTGATGFIGSHMARLLARNGCEVYALVRKDSKLWRISDIVPALHLVSGDLLEMDQLHRQLREIGPELCIHLAWYVEPGKYLMSLDNLSCLTASIDLASRLSSLGCKRLVAVGTCFEYDTDLGYLSEDSRTAPRTMYAASKLGLQLVLEHLAQITGMQVAWIRLFYQYGPFEDQRRLVPSVICSLLSNREAKVTKGEQVRDFLHVEDVASAILAVSRSQLSGPVNVGSGKPTLVRDLVAKIGEILGHSELIRFGALRYGASEPFFICANNRRLVENTDWVPHYDLEGGLRGTVMWWKSHMDRLGQS